MPPRSWGWWTEQKLDILGDYLTAFTRASTRAGMTVYLDLFAGRPENVSRDRGGRQIRGSARRALDTQPPLSMLRFFELDATAASLESALTAEYPDRVQDFRVVPGDCNATIASALAEVAEFNWAPTFALLDQQSTEVQWPTIEHLARHKRADKPKTELWLLCASGLLPRGLRFRTETLDTSVADRMSSMFGTDIWLEALQAARENLLPGAEFRRELTNLMRWRLEQELGYQTTLDFQVTNTSGNGIFDMIFATDHWAGEKIMTDLYSTALRRQPALRQKAQLQRRQDREEAQGVHGLFDLTELAPSPAADGTGFRIKHEPLPPHPPYRFPG
ncbi:MAG TPA: three-Cys-motif partner protein TcmP [Streptosporangiaceae bacterium]|nr:three-Cys-motif partner protein TcmP [Streptosporangiaceae bacterium]